MSAVSPWSYLGLQLRVVYTYLRLLVWPYPQSIEYDFSASHALWLRLVEIAGLAAIVAAGMWAVRTERWKIAGLSILAFLLLLAPTSSIIPSTDAAFEHRLYLPMMAFSLLLAWALSLVPKRSAVAAVILVALALVTLNRGAVWASDVALWKDAASHAPQKARAWFNLGAAQADADPQGARVSLRRAIELQPKFPDAFVSFGVIEQNARNFPQAVLYFQEALRQDEKLWPAWYNLGNAWFAMGEYDRAIVSFQRALNLNRDYYAAHYNIAVAHLAAGRPAEAIPHIRTVLDWEPNSAEAQQLLADALRRAQ